MMPGEAFDPPSQTVSHGVSPWKSLPGAASGGLP
jgi:hypothetical protein